VAGALDGRADVVDLARSPAYQLPVSSSAALAPMGKTRTMAKPPYKIARQEHVGNMLDELRDRGRLSWRWDYEGSSAVYYVTLAGHDVRKLDTKAAEQVAQRECDALGIRWKPVPHPGGETQLADTLEWIDAPSAS
jgi:hypothetical protein